MSFTTNSSHLVAKSLTNAFEVVADSIIVERNQLIKGDLTVLGNTTFANITLDNANINNLTVNNFTAANPVPIASGGTGLSNIGSPQQILAVNSAGTALSYQNNVPSSLSNPAQIVGTGYTGTPTFNFGIESSLIPNEGRGFIKISPAAFELVLGTTSSNVIKISGLNGIGNFTYNSIGATGIFQVNNGQGATTLTTAGSTGTISMSATGGSLLFNSAGVTLNATGGSLLFNSVGVTMSSGQGGTLLLTDLGVTLGTSGGFFSLSTGGGFMSMSTGAGSTSISTLAGILSLSTGIGALNINTSLGAITISTSLGSIFMTTGIAGAINIGTIVGFVNLYGTAVTLAAPIIYIGAQLAFPISAVVLAATTVTGVTGAWTLTTGIIDIYAAGGITLRSGLGGIFGAITLLGNSTSLNGPTTMNGQATVNGITLMNGQATITATTTSFSAGTLSVVNNTSTNSAVATLYTPSLASGQSTAILFGVANTASSGAYLNFAYNSTATLISSTWGFASSVPANKITLLGDGTNTITGNTSVTGNISSSQNINWGTLQVSTSTVLTVNSPKAIFVIAGTSIIITLPDATTLTVGWNYIITNNSSQTITINTSPATLLATIAAGQNANLYLLTNATVAGTWSVNTAGGNTLTAPIIVPTFSPSTTILTLASLVGISANTTTLLDVYSNSLNQATAPIAQFNVPNLGVGQYTYLNFGKAAGTGLAGQLTYTSGATLGDSTVALGFTSATTPNGANFISATQAGIVTLAGTMTYINSDATVTGTNAIFNSGVLDVVNLSTVSASNATFLAPNLASGNSTAILFGVINSNSSAAYLNFTYNTTATSISSTWGFANAVPANNISLLGNGTNAITGATSVTGNFSAAATNTLINSGVLDVINLSTATATVATFLAPNLASGNSMAILFGVINSNSSAAYLNFAYNTTAASISSTWGFANAVPGNNISLLGNGTNVITGTTTITGNLSCTQNINTGSLAVNTNTTLTVNSPKTILVRGGPGVTITLPNATTLLIGWNYIVNNNSGQTVTINDAAAVPVASIQTGQLANLYLLTNPNAAGTWDSHISGSGAGPVAPFLFTTASDSTTVINLSNTATTANSVPVLAITSSSTAQATSPMMSLFQPSMGTTQLSYINFGKSLGVGLSGQLTYTSDATLGSSTVGLGFSSATSAPSNFISSTQAGAVTITAVAGVTSNRMAINQNSTATTCLTVSNTTTSSNFASTFRINNSAIVQCTAALAAMYQSGLVTGQFVYMQLGRSSALGLSAQLSYTTDTTTIANSMVGLGFSGTNQVPSNFLTATQGGIITLTGLTTTVIGTNTSFNNGVLSVTNNATTAGAIATFFTPALATAQSTAILFGRANATGQGMYLNFNYNTTSTSISSTWGFANATPANNFTLLGTGTNTITGDTDMFGSFRAYGLVDGVNRGSGVCIGLDAGGYANISLNGTGAGQSSLGYIDFSQSGTDYINRIQGAVLGLSYTAISHNFIGTLGATVTLTPATISTSMTICTNSSNVLVSRIGGSGTVYNTSSGTVVSNATWTNVNNITTLRQKGNGTLNWVNQGTGFRNNSSQTLLVTVSFTAKKYSNFLGLSAIRIVLNNTTALMTQDVAALDAVSVSASTYLDDNETIQCQMFQNDGALLPNSFENVVVTINTYPCIQ